MDLNIKINENDLVAIRRKFAKLAELGKSDGMTRKMANVLRTEAEDAFDDERSPEGIKWQDLKPDYKKHRYARGFNGKILQVSGLLVQSLNIDYGDDFAAVGVSEPYGVYHQLGTKHMPARPFLGISEAGVDEIKQILQNALNRALSS